MVRTLGVSLLALSWGAMLSSPANAQSASAGGSASAGTASVSEVVVTAQRRNERLTDVPISVTALSKDALMKSGVTSTGDLGQVVPGLTMDRSGPFSQPTVRGIGSPVTGPGIGTSVATYIDGFYQPSSTSNDFQLADVSSVQVLKGPQGTLFGHDSTGGAILVTTMTPTFKPSGLASVSYGSFNDVSAQIVASDGITDNLAVYGALYYHSTDGFSHNVVTGRHDQAGYQIIGRGKILWEPTSKLKFTLAYANADVDDPYGVAENAYHGITDAALTPGAIIPTARDETANSTSPITRVLYYSIYLTTEYDLGFASLKSYTGWRSEQDHVLT
ncbi:MAG: TonB-dependent receptor plug domain-containing protein, partial [Caulobacteraceae bacterium]